MSKKPQTVRGMNDILPEVAARWRYLESEVERVIEAYGYEHLRLPLLEHTEVFRRSIGEVTDIVEKEMYTFDDDGDSLTLRPEATASMVRAGITNGLFHNQRQKLWTVGPMFRRERPQAGRYRQFYQYDVEAMGFAGPDIDAELIVMSARLWERLGIDRIHLEINSLGTAESRASYRDALIEYFNGVKSQLDEDSIRRLDKNPLRILDTKNPEMQEVVAAAPLMIDHLDEASAEHFAGLKLLLDVAGVQYTVNPRLVRGLDYYSRTVFEWVTDALGAQNAVCAGGRYDGLVEKLGGRPTPAIGWAMGVERFVALYEACGGKFPATGPDVYFVAVGEGTGEKAFAVAEELRNTVDGIRIETNLGGGSFKAQMKRADKSAAAYALVLGEQELSEGRIGLKPLRSDDEQESIALDELAAVLQVRLSG